MTWSDFIGWFAAPITLLLIHERGDRIACWIIRKSASMLATDSRERSQEEWLADCATVQGNAWKIYHAMGIAFRFGAPAAISRVKLPRFGSPSSSIARTLFTGLLVAIMAPAMIVFRLLIFLAGKKSVVATLVERASIPIRVSDVAQGVESIRRAGGLWRAIRSIVIVDTQSKSNDKDDSDPKPR
ncbi:MAG: hypothetical protein EON61_11940 [Alphaproteobacteria bacterium]|nr:MAG: hypothetical protein EON61_11940 [Alphaproteobacteria bacterium]